MHVFVEPEEVRRWSREARSNGLRVGFVPTMGFLHEGHLSLMDRALELTDRLAVSIFVNPTQFGPNEDFGAYPRDLERDLELCQSRGVDAVFAPDRAAVYGPDHRTYVEVEQLGEHLCGASRPGHFRGVTTVVSKLFNIVQPDVAVFGAKDAQQARMIQQMTRDLNFPVKIELGETVREADGLAMSSRNVNLTDEHRRQAPALRRALLAAQENLMRGTGSARVLLSAVEAAIAEHAPDGVVDYITLVDWENLAPIDGVEGKALLALAVRFGDVRLIDNIILEKT